MKIRKAFFSLGFVLASIIISLPAARANDLNQATRITFSRAVQVPGHILPAGTYLFVLADHISNRDMVQIYSPDRSVLYGTILTVPTERPGQSDKTAIVF